MRAGLRYGILALLLLLVACGGLSLWVFASSGGARWVLDSASAKAGASLDIRKVEGSFLGGLRLEDVRLRRQALDVKIHSLRLSWQPLSLLTGHVTLGDLALRDVSIHDATPSGNEPLALTWPHVGGLPAFLSGSVRAFRVTGLSYQRMDASPFELSDLSAGISWRRGVLGIHDLRVHSPVAGISGDIAAGFLKPSLKIRTSVRFGAEAAGQQELVLKTDLSAAQSRQQIAGPVTVTVIAPSGVQTSVSGEAVISRSSIRLQQLVLTQAGRAGSIRADADMDISGPEPSIRLNAVIDGLGLEQELDSKAAISGDLKLEGTAAAFSGRFSFAAAGSKLLPDSLAGDIQGGGNQLNITRLVGAWLDGSIYGKLAVRWEKTVTLRADLRGRELDPAYVDPRWKGVVNANISAEVRRSDVGSLEASLSGRLLNSRLLDRPLTGSLDAHYGNDNILIRALELHGNGFDLQARGDLGRRLAFNASIRDLAGLVPGAGGRLEARGWARLRSGSLAGEVSGSGRGLSGIGLTVRSFSFEAFLSDARNVPLRFDVGLNNLEYGGVRVASGEIHATGTRESHRISASLSAEQGNVHLEAGGAYRLGRWEGEIARLSGRDSVGPWRMTGPAGLRLSKESVTVSSLRIAGGNAEFLALDAALGLSPLSGSVHAKWKDVDLARVNAWSADIVVTGKCTGDARAEWLRNRLRTLRSHIDLAGSVLLSGISVGVMHGEWQTDWTDRGLRSSLDVAFSDGGGLKARVTSSAQAARGLPERADVSVAWKQIDLSLFRSKLPTGTSLTGRLSGTMKGDILRAQHLQVTVASAITGGAVSWQQGQRQFTAELQTAVLSGEWNGNRATGTADLKLKDYGTVHAEAEVPLPASIPPVIDTRGKLRISVNGQMQETGLLTALFPGLIRESQGNAELALDVGGTWEKPVVTGSARLEKAGALLPSAGIRLKDVKLRARWNGEEIVIDSFRAESGPGHIEGRAVIGVRHLKVTEYRGTIRGDRFQTIHLPELQLLSSPDLRIEGTTESVAVRGEISIPELSAVGQQAGDAVSPSKDVVIVGRPPAAKKDSSLALDIGVKVHLGDRIFVKAQGMDVQLEGSAELSARSLDEIRANGVLNVKKGKYSAYGVNLDIARGRIAFSGPVEAAGLDMLAVRKVKDVEAGVLVSGTLKDPRVTLYSKPAMADADVMAYIVLGQPLGADRQEISLVARAAGMLLSGSDSVSVQDQIRQRVGLDTLDVESGGGDISRSLVTVGKYLTPQLYLSYGRSLFTDANIFKLRYAINRNWEVETQSGAESGADIFYKIEFR